MTTETETRFTAAKLVRLVVFTAERRCELQFGDSQGKTHVVSLPLPAAVDLASLICDAADRAPYLVGGIQRRARSKSGA